MKPVTEVYSLLSHHPTSCTAGFTPRRPSSAGDLLQEHVGPVSLQFASMRTLLQVLVVGALSFLDATSASAADCMCDRLSAEGCAAEVSVLQEPTSPPLWCERSDDPRCMPASTHGTGGGTLVPVAMSWAQPIRFDTPPRAVLRIDVCVEGEARTEHSRRVERPPR